MAEPDRSPRIARNLERPIIMLEPWQVPPTVDRDMSLSTQIDAYIYTANPDYLRTVFGPYTPFCKIRVITDWKHRGDTMNLRNLSPQISVRTWPANRTMHDKTIILHGAWIVYLLTANMNRGSFYLSKNRCARANHLEFFNQVATDFENDWKNSKPVPHKNL